MTISTRIAVLESRLNAQDVAIDAGMSTAEARSLIAAAESRAQEMGRTLTRREIVKYRRMRRPVISNN